MSSAARRLEPLVLNFSIEIRTIMTFGFDCRESYLKAGFAYNVFPQGNLGLIDSNDWLKSPGSRLGIELASASTFNKSK